MSSIATKRTRTPNKFLQEEDVPWRAPPPGHKFLPRINRAPVLHLRHDPTSDYALAVMKRRDPIGEGFATEAFLEAAGPDCLVPGLVRPVRVLGLQVWPIHVKLNFMESVGQQLQPVGRQLRSIGKIQSKRRSKLQPERLSKLVFIKYNEVLHERFQTRRLQNKNEDYDHIIVDDLNYSFKWMTGQLGACNEFVYEEDGLNWAEFLDSATKLMDAAFQDR